MSILSTLPLLILSDSAALNHLLQSACLHRDWKTWAFGAFVKRDASRPDHVFYQRWEMFRRYEGIDPASQGPLGWEIDLMQALSLVAEGYLEMRNGRLYVKTLNEESGDVEVDVNEGKERKYRYSDIFSRWQNIRARMTTMPLKMLMLARHKRPAGHILAHPYSAMTADYIRAEGLNEAHLHLNGVRYPEDEWLADIYNVPAILKCLAKDYKRKESIREHYYNLNPILTPRVAAERMRLARVLREAVLLLEANAADSEKVVDDAFHAIRLCAAGRSLKDAFPHWVDVPQRLDERIRQEMKMWIVAFELLEKNAVFTYKKSLQCFLHVYLLIQNEHIQLNYHTEQRKGFASFDVSMGHRKISVGNDEYYRQTFYNLMKVAEARSDNCIEVRVTPKALGRDYKMLLREYAEAWKRREQDRASEASLRGFPTVPRQQPQLIFVAHFIKDKVRNASPYKKSDELVPLYEAERRQHMMEARSVARTARLLMQHYRVPVGIDAANSEMNQPPEVFSSAYRLFEQRSDISHKTFHCGEDFLHLISGIRAVYEAVVFLNLREGNRIGHGISIGIHPRRWVQSMPAKLIVSQRDWFLDMVFVWMSLRDRHPAAAARAEKEALRLSDLIFESSLPQGGLRPHSVHSLEELFRIRQFDPLDVRKRSQGHQPITDFHQKEWAAIDAFEEKYGKNVLALYLVWSMNRKCRSAQEKLIEVETSFLSVEELVLLQQRVQYLLSTRDVVIETLPVSNLRIGQYREIQDHHVLRWLKVEGYRVDGDADLNICMGSDDPGIFATDIKNEFYHLFMALRNAGLSEPAAVEKLRQVNSAGRVYAFRELPDLSHKFDSVKTPLHTLPRKHTLWQKLRDTSQ